MSDTVQPFLAFVTDAETRLLQARSRSSLHSDWDHDSGVLRGYWYAGAVADVELQAGLDTLKKAYRQRFEQLPTEH